MARRSKADWDRIGELYPDIADGLTAEYVNDRLANDPEIMWRIVVDIYDSYKRDEERARGEIRVGRRPKPDWVPVEELVARVFPQPYTVAPFTEALAALIGSESQRAFAPRVPCNQSTLSRLLSGEVAPDMPMLEGLARAGGKEPYYFAEWRALYFGQLVRDSYMIDPRRSISAMRALRGKLEQDRKGRTSLTTPTRTA